MKYIHILICILALMFSASCAQQGPKDGDYTIHLLTTNDVHGRYFDSLYVDGRAPKASLLAVSAQVDSLRNLYGKDNVVFVDAGDCLQGDNASYYFNFVDTVHRHIYARMVEYMKYDAVVVGNHDIETGHRVYDRIPGQMSVPFLAANALRTGEDGKVLVDCDGKPQTHFPGYTIVRRQGLKIVIIGFTNPNIKEWLPEELWTGLVFEALVPYVQEYVDKVKEMESPDVVVVAAHTGTGSGDGSVFENQGLYLFNSLNGVDFVVAAHDHRPLVLKTTDRAFVNSGSHCRNIGHGILNVKVRDGKCVEKSFDSELIPVDVKRTDERMRKMFRKDYEAVREFTLRPIGQLHADLLTRDAYRGMSDYVNLLNTIALHSSGADVSVASPLTFNGFVKAGTLIYDDLFTIYPFENRLFTLRMTGQEIKDYLEASYDGWINTVSGKSEDEHLLKITAAPDPRTGQDRWSFVGRAYNLDSAAGLVYTVDVTKPLGKRVEIISTADGKEFCLNREYVVAMNSYRASGGGGLLKSAGIDSEKMETRLVARYPEIRDLLYDYLKECGAIDPVVTGAPEVIGGWKFVPESLAGPLMERDMDLLF